MFSILLPETVITILIGCLVLRKGDARGKGCEEDEGEGGGYLDKDEHGHGHVLECSQYPHHGDAREVPALVDTVGD